MQYPPDSPAVQWDAGRPAPRRGSANCGPQARLSPWPISSQPSSWEGLLYFWEQRTYDRPYVARKKDLLPGPTLEGCCEESSLGQCWLKGSLQYKRTHAIQLLTSPDIDCHRAKFCILSRWIILSFPPEHKQNNMKSYILIIMATGYF